MLAPPRPAEDLESPHRWVPVVMPAEEPPPAGSVPQVLRGELVKQTVRRMLSREWVERPPAAAERRPPARSEALPESSQRTVHSRSEPAAGRWPLLAGRSQLSAGRLVPAYLTAVQCALRPEERSIPRAEWAGVQAQTAERA